MKKAFTLIELLVVIAIIGILAGILIASFSGGAEAARAATCLTNLRNLATACQSYGSATAHYPNAGSVMQLGIDTSRGMRNVKKSYTETRGWISWLSRNKFPSESPETPTSLGFLDGDNKEDALFAVTNGALYKYVGGNSAVYVCPCHRHASGSTATPVWSYFMNAYFKWDSCQGYAYTSGAGLDYGLVKKTDRLLLFAEIPFRGAGEWRPSGNGDNTDNDAILQYRGCDKAPSLGGKDRRDGTEYIGGNHPIGSVNRAKGWTAHVAFADAHVEKINVTGLSDESLRELTACLCTGKDYSIANGNVEELK